MSIFIHRTICTRKTPNLAIRKEARSILWKGSPLRPFRLGLIKSGGRNNTGRKMFMARGGGHKRSCRSVNLAQPKEISNCTLSMKVLRVEYDPTRSAWLSLLESRPDTMFPATLFYSLHTHGVLPGSDLVWGRGAPISDGNRLPLVSIPSNTWVHSVETTPMAGAKISRSAGTRCKLLRSSPDSKTALLVQPSGEKVELSPSCFATVGMVSNPRHNQVILRKAGVSRWLGQRPFSRGIAKNPVDHPHGGRTNGGCHPKTPWGKLTRGVKTRSVKKPTLLKF